MTAHPRRATITVDRGGDGLGEHAHGGGDGLRAEQLEAWCALDPHLRARPGDPTGFETTIADGRTLTVSAGSEPPFITFSGRLPLGASPSAERLRELVDARSALIDARPVEGEPAVDLTARVHEDGLDAQSFLLAASELGKLARSIEAAVGAAQPQARSFSEFEAEQRRLFAADRAREAAPATEAPRDGVETYVPPAAAAAAATPSPPQPVTCATCGSGVAPGRAFCSNCGTPVGGAPPAPAASPPAPAPQGGGALAFPTSPLRWGVIAGFVVAAVGTFLDWISFQGVGASAWADESRYRVADWLDTDLPVDALLVVAVAVLGIALLVARRLSRGGSSLVLALVLGAGLAVLGVLEIAYITSEADFEFVGIGLWAVTAGGAAAAACAFFELRRGAGAGAR